MQWLSSLRDGLAKDAQRARRALERAHRPPAGGRRVLGGARRDADRRRLRRRHHRKDRRSAQDRGAAAKSARGRRRHPRVPRRSWRTTCSTRRSRPRRSARKPHVVLVVGVNGSGKTTTIGKLAAQERKRGRSVMLVAGDTFRAAAAEQLAIWAKRARRRDRAPARKAPIRRPSSSTVWPPPKSRRRRRRVHRHGRTAADQAQS